MDFGLVVSPAFLPEPDELAALRPSFLRSIVYRVEDVDRLASLGLPVFLTVNNEMAEVRGDWSGWDDAIAAIGEHAAGRVFAVGCGNELDLYWQDDPADVPPEFAADLVTRASAILRPLGIRTAATSVAGRDWQTYLERMAALCRDDADFFDLHAYGQRPTDWGTPGWMNGDLRVALSRAREIAGRPIIMSEYGVKVGDAGGEDGVSSFMTAATATLDQLGPAICPHAAWFAWCDQIGTPSERGEDAFGLVAEDGRRRPAWQTFADLSAHTPIPVEVPAMPALTRCLSAIWQAVLPLPYDDTIAQFGIPSYWRDHLQELGSPVGEEIDDDEHAGCKLQPFALGVLRWRPDGTVERAA